MREQQYGEGGGWTAKADLDRNGKATGLFMGLDIVWR
jgi:hypothetical protein